MDKIVDINKVRDIMSGEQKAQDDVKQININAMKAVAKGTDEDVALVICQIAKNEFTEDTFKWYSYACEVMAKLSLLINSNIIPAERAANIHNHIVGLFEDFIDQAITNTMAAMIGEYIDEEE